MNAHTTSVTIRCLPEKAFQYISKIENLLSWAPGFADSVRFDGGKWMAKKGTSLFETRIVSDEGHGTIDFHIIPVPGVVIVAPSRVVANGREAEYVFTLFQSSGMDDASFANLIDDMREEFRTLKRLLE